MRKLSMMIVLAFAFFATLGNNTFAQDQAAMSVAEMAAAPGALPFLSREAALEKIASIDANGIFLGMKCNGGANLFVPESGSPRNIKTCDVQAAEILILSLRAQASLSEKVAGWRVALATSDKDARFSPFIETSSGLRVSTVGELADMLDRLEAVTRYNHTREWFLVGLLDLLERRATPPSSVMSGDMLQHLQEQISAATQRQRIARGDSRPIE